MNRLKHRGIIRNNSNCLFLFETQTGDSTVVGNRSRSYINGRLLSTTPPALDATNKKWGSQSTLFTHASSTMSKFYRDIAKTITTVTANNTFTIASDYTTYFIPGKIINITGATNNNGTYTVVSSSFSTVTTIVIAQTTLVTGGTLGTVGHTNPITQIGTGDFTVEAVFKTPSSFLTSYEDIFGCDYSANFALEAITSYPRLVFWIGGGSNTVIDPIALNTWYHILIVRKGGTLKVWLDGTLKISVANSTSIATNNDFYVGDDGYTVNYGYGWNSNVQRVGLYKGAMYWNSGTTTGKKHFDITKYMKNFGAIAQQ